MKVPLAKAELLEIEDRKIVKQKSKALSLAIFFLEFVDLKYCITDRIWKAVVETKKRLTSEEVEDARQTFIEYEQEKASDALLLLKMISTFLRASPSTGNCES